MLTPHRRHLASCEHVARGWNFTLCGCPIWCDGKLNGARYRKSLDTTSWERALRRIQILESGGELAPEAAPAAGRTFAKAAPAFLLDCKHRNLKDSTLASYKRSLGHLEQTMGSRAVASIDTATLDTYRSSRQIAPRTWRKELEHLRAFFAWCVERGWCTGNPAKRLRMPKVEGLATLPFSAAEITGLIDAADAITTDDPGLVQFIRQRARALVYTLLYSGLRISDIAQLRRAALDPRSGHLTLRAMKNHVDLKVLLHGDAKKALETLPAASPEFFFWSGRGDLITCVKNMRRTVQRLGKLAEVHAHPHRFRDTFAVELLTQGADIRTVQLLLGHTSVKTTEKHYAHFVAAHQALLDSAAARLDFSGKAPRPLLVRPPQKRLRNP